jgi:hypothetical protein
MLNKMFDCDSSPPPEDEPDERYVTDDQDVMVILSRGAKLYGQKLVSLRLHPEP